MHPLLKTLAGTDRRSIGDVDRVVAKVLGDPRLFEVVFEGMLSDDPVIRMRSADAVEKITVNHPEYLTDYKGKLLGQIARVEQQEVRWHVSQLFSRIDWSPRERRQVVDILRDYLADESKIVKTFAMQALADIAMLDQELRGPIVRDLEWLTRQGSPAMQSRGRKLLAKLKYRE
jgi:hypothetical protein